MISSLGLYSIPKDRTADELTSRLVRQPRQITPRVDKKSRLVHLTEPTGLAVERYKMLRRRLTNLRPQGGVILITSPNPGEGKTLTSVNLAWCLAEGGHSTCLVDLDFRAPGVLSTLGATFDEDGVEDVLTGKRSLDEAIRQVGDRSFYVLGVRERLASPAQLLGPASLKPFISELRERFKWVVLDFAPVIPMADVSEALPHVDGALMIIRSGKTHRDMVTPSVEMLGSKLWGAVLNDSPIDGSSYYGYYGIRNC